MNVRNYDAEMLRLYICTSPWNIDSSSNNIFFSAYHSKPTVAHKCKHKQFIFEHKQLMFEHKQLIFEHKQSSNTNN